MYLARFSYSITPANRDRAVELLQKEVDAAREQDMEARLLVPMTRPPRAAALQFEVVLPDLQTFETFRDHGVGGEEETRAWLRDLSDILLEPPSVELLRIAGDGPAPAASEGEQREGRKLIGTRTQHA